MTTENYEELFGQLGDQPNVKISNIRGHVNITSWAQDEVEIKATIDLDSGDEELTQVQIYQEKNGRVVAKVEFNKGHSWVRLAKPCLVNFEIRVPVKCDLKVNTVSSSSDIIGVEGRIKVSSVSGKTYVEELTGDLDLNTVSGKLHGSGLAGVLDLDSVSGGVKLEDSSLTSIKANTVSGGLHIHTPLDQEGRYRFSSVSGGVSLHLPDNTPCTAKISTLSGSIKSGHRATYTSGSKRSKVVDFNGGGVPVKMSSVSGGMKLHSNGGNGLEKPVVKRKTQEERLSVLTKLQDGEFSVEDAMAALD